MNYVTAEKQILPVKVSRISLIPAETSLPNPAGRPVPAKNFVKNRQSFRQYDFSPPGNTFFDKHLVTTEQIGKSCRREILLQIKVWKPQEYFVYFKVSKLQSWGKRSDGSRRRFVQWLP